MEMEADYLQEAWCHCCAERLLGLLPQSMEKPSLRRGKICLPYVA